MTAISTAETDERPGRRRSGPAVLVVALLVFFSARGGFPDEMGQNAGRSPAQSQSLLRLLGIIPSEESVDYVSRKTQFQLHTLLTEQRHPRTWNLSEKARESAAAALEMLFGVDEDVARRLEELSSASAGLETLCGEMEKAVLEGRRIYIYGCGATGRLAKQMESSFWRPFWRGLRKHKELWAKLPARVAEKAEEVLIGEMTGADRALISSLEGFEDLQLIGRLQLRDRGVKKGDLVICVTEGGETSSVIGTAVAALDEWKAAPGYAPAEARKRVYFVYNNPDDRLRPFERSRRVLDEPGIAKINLTTGPQAITGSTRMQATTIETFVLGSLLEEAVERVLRRYLSRREAALAGFGDDLSLNERLRTFRGILAEVKKASVSLAKFTELEAETYGAGKLSTYFARDGLITVFIDSTERSPTFRLYPLDTVEESRRRCWIQVWTPAPDLQAAWRAFLGRPFRGLREMDYRKPFEEEIDDPFLKAKALESLKKAGDDQRLLYDFSFAEPNVGRRGPGPGDLGVAACLVSDEPLLAAKASPFRAFCDLFLSRGGRSVLISVGGTGPGKPSAAAGAFARSYESAGGKLLGVSLGLSSANDPLQVNAHIGLKMLLNAHSTAVMARLGRVIGNTMTNVSPSNLKLIGRATYLIQSHVNDVLGRPAWVRRYGARKSITYGEANAVLFDSISYLKERTRQSGQTAEVALSIIRILESLKEYRDPGPARALQSVGRTGLGPYLAEFN